MNTEQLIEKWEKQIALHKRVCEDALMYTKEERFKNSHYAQAICAVVADLKQVKNLSSNTVLADNKNCDYESSNGKWVFERSSGYAGYRCEKCATWIYENQKRECKCDTEY